MPRGENTYDKILDTALHLLSQNGYEATSIKAITDQIGLTKAAFYAHFQTKSQMVSKLIERYETEFLDEMIRVANEQPGTAIDKLHRLVSFSSGAGLKYRKYVVLFYSLSAEMNDDIGIEPIRTRCRRKIEKFLTGLFDLGKLEGLVRKDADSTLLTLLLLSFSRVMFKQSIDKASRINRKEYISIFRKVFFKGIKAE